VPLSRRQIYRRRRLTVFGGAALILSVALYLPVTLLAPLHSTAAVVLPYDAPVTTAAELPFPGYGATAVGAVGFPGILASSGSEDPVPIASITKLVTALVVLEAKPLGVGEDGPEITFTKDDVAIYHALLARQGKVEPVRAGLVLTQRQVMELTLVPSANNYAQSLATWAFGSEAAFLPVAQAWLAAHHLDHITVTDSTGMNPENVATATDLIELGKLALENPLINEIVSMKEISVPNVGEFKSTNNLIGKKGIKGLKTGTLDGWGANLLFAADYTVGSDTVTIVGTMLGAKDHKLLNVDVQTLLERVESNFHEVQLTEKGDEYGTYTTLWGDESGLVSTKNLSVVVWGATPVALLVEAPKVTLGRAGTDVGSLNFTVGEEKLEVPLELSKTIDDPGPGWRLMHPTELF
jgi:D-alanyl-D-alanine carboxypeptidase (penicillin-binding protein 5/6)